MKRLLSWIVLLLECVLFAVVVALLTILAVKLFFLIYSGAGATLFWVLVVFEGMAFLGFVLMGIVLGSGLVVAGSQSVWKSKKGARYLTVGIVIFVLYLLSVVFLAVGLVRTSNPYYAVPYWVVMTAFGIALSVMGRKTAIDEGGPPTKRQILEQKLAKLDEREERNGQNS